MSDIFSSYFFSLQNPVKQEISKTFCCLCCTSGPLTVAAYLPKTGFGKTEIIPILVEADNASNVEVEKLKAFLYRVIFILFFMESDYLHAMSA